MADNLISEVLYKITKWTTDMAVSTNRLYNFMIILVCHTELNTTDKFSTM